mgnify:CR=1 FL=1
MGMTPLAGLMMGTRCGDLDPSVVNYLKYNLEITGHELDEILNKKSGLLGVSGVSSDKRDVEEAAEHGNVRAQLASDMLNYQIKKTIGSYIAAMGGVDAIVFTGGIGEPYSFSTTSLVSRASMTPTPAPRSATTWTGWASASTPTRTAMPTSRAPTWSR